MINFIVSVVIFTLGYMTSKQIKKRDNIFWLGCILGALVNMITNVQT
jgi:hypothetical protein